LRDRPKKPAVLEQHASVPPSPSSGRPVDYEMRLSPEEAQIARNSFSAPGMTNAQKEMMYLQNKRRYEAAKKDGSYSDQGGGG
jgi:hypothetical protein